MAHQLVLVDERLHQSEINCDLLTVFVKSIGWRRKRRELRLSQGHGGFSVASRLRDLQIIHVDPVVGLDLGMAVHAELEEVLEVVVHVRAGGGGDGF